MRRLIVVALFAVVAGKLDAQVRIGFVGEKNLWELSWQSLQDPNRTRSDLWIYHAQREVNSASADAAPVEAFLSQWAHGARYDFDGAGGFTFTPKGGGSPIHGTYLYDSANGVLVFSGAHSGPLGSDPNTARHATAIYGSIHLHTYGVPLLQMVRADWNVSAAGDYESTLSMHTQTGKAYTQSDSTFAQIYSP